MTTPPDPLQSNPLAENQNGSASDNIVKAKPPSEATVSQEKAHLSALPLSRRTSTPTIAHPLLPPITLTAIVILIVGLTIDNFWIGLSGAIVSLLVSVPVVLPPHTESALAGTSSRRSIAIYSHFRNSSCPLRSSFANGYYSAFRYIPKPHRI
jgi:hypothetical protein